MKLTLLFGTGSNFVPQVALKILHTESHFKLSVCNEETNDLCFLLIMHLYVKSGLGNSNHKSTFVNNVSFIYIPLFADTSCSVC